MDYECKVYNKNTGECENYIIKDFNSDDDITKVLSQEIFKHYWIESIKHVNRPSDKCGGCEENKCNQESHMECPSGCLHDKTLCSSCYNKLL